MGLAVSPDNKIVNVAGGQENKIYLFSVDSGEKLDSIDCSVSENRELTPDGYIGDMKLSNMQDDQKEKPEYRLEDQKRKWTGVPNSRFQISCPVMLN